MNLEELHLPDFRGRAITIYLINEPMEHAVTLDSPTFEVQGDRLFIGGSRLPTSNQDWTGGIPMWIAWDQVANYFVFDSAAAFAERIGSGHGGFFGFLGGR